MVPRPEIKYLWSKNASLFNRSIYFLDRKEAIIIISVFDFPPHAIATHLCTLFCAGMGRQQPRGCQSSSLLCSGRACLCCESALPCLDPSVRWKGKGEESAKWIFSVQEKDQVPIPLLMCFLNSSMGRGILIKSIPSRAFLSNFLRKCFKCLRDERISLQWKYFRINFILLANSWPAFLWTVCARNKITLAGFFVPSIAWFRALFTPQIKVNHRSPAHSAFCVVVFLGASEPLPTAHLHQINGTSAAASAKSSLGISGFLKQAERTPSICVYKTWCRLRLLRDISRLTFVCAAGSRKHTEPKLK